ncbi:LacI family DNA-binding transcriptional regulator [Halalkalibacterium ligniniphilum]|uniref:LacI family DNA-binding transcriptional regulator n=1 Tax=Halalkalibacterium ligniniphilum TaxID=1134413 RepID=UPI00034D41DD|nr:LacI family DNA-binding transcriptional regulator [Halalkalibacterium ligniniphilum]
MATIRDVAKEAEVSVATVSRVLNSNGYVNEDTRKKVLAAIQALNYTPNSVARSLYKKSSKTIGLIVPDIKNPFFPELARAVEDVLNKNNYTLILCNSDEKAGKEKEYIEVLKQKYVDGFIIVTSTLTASDVDGLNVPIISLDRIFESNVPIIASKNYEGARKATRYLIDIGCKKIAHIRGPLHISTADDRCFGYYDEMESNGMLEETLIANGSYDIKKTTEVTKELLLNNPDVDGIFAGNDVMAVGVLKAAEQTGRVVPDDLAVIGFDGIYLCEVTSPQLSTIAQPIYEMGYRAAETLINLIEGRFEKSQGSYSFDVQLIERQSTKRK